MRNKHPGFTNSTEFRVLLLIRRQIST